MSNTRDFGEQPNDETSSFPHQTTENYDQAPYVPSGGVYTVPPQSQAPKRRAGVGTAFAVALVTGLAAGGGAGYVAGSAGSSQSVDAPSGEQAQENALENPSVSNAAEAPDGSVEKVAAQVLPSVVSIEVATRSGGAEGSGSIISSDGYVLTNHHVIAAGAQPGTEIQVTLNDGSRHRAQYVASDVNTDIGVLKIEGVDNLPVVQFGNSNDLRVGQQVVAVGSPLGLSATVTSGIVSALNRPVRASQGGGESSLMDGIQTDAAINPGNSGGPLVDMNGNLIGMNSAIASLSQSSFGGESSGGSIGLGFSIPSNFAKRVADQLIRNGEATQPMLGVQVSIAQAITGGAVVAAVEPDSPAEQAGLKRGDVITRLNDRLIDSADALIAATRSQDFGQTVTLQVERQGEGEPIPVEVTLSTE
ncbi:putative serine protease PepD [Corynebacterium coyleae]|uniref:Trypsin-like peptidase domain-containing protein n=1 Tax=Corynebacterium coyleae TaxID=53374 RepID=A0ABX8KTF8_9CORY|nr:trypsin-like peptidase domain-containing protein [Corynebacterium coyleae]QXB17976.1 trypsin-like peptidase domain-containing protein [Corynebacterium coyleae]WJY79430.1 Periplasmic pH-dependent serine endoprotease DegQ precursor [Corynebacterium coyleae]SEB79239.1 putative serine protease PepD [Corynebacterium coyleae]